MGVGDFVVQIPPQLFLMTCGSGILLIAAWVFIIWRRSSRKTGKRTEPAPDITSLGLDGAAASSADGDDVQGAFTRVRKAVWNFFFYSEEEKAQLTQETTSTISATPPPAAPPDTVEVMRIWRDVIDGSIVVQIGGETYRTMADIRAADEERRFMAILRDLARIAKDLPPAPPEPLMAETAAPAEPSPTPPPPSAAAPPAPDDDGPAPDPAVPVEPPPAQQPVTPPPSFQSQPAAPGLDDAEPIGSFFDNVRKAIRTGGKSAQAIPSAEPMSIAEQIEEMLQYRLTLTSDFAGRSIHVRQGLHGAVLIEVDGTYFESVDDVTDAEAREFIRGIIEEWQDRQ